MDFLVVSAEEIELILKLFAALCLGAIIGLDREMHERPAGLRTHALVCMGATLFTILSLNIAASLNDADPSRIASNIVVGIGFLGAGTIFKEKDRIVGLTTAADLWVLAAVGMAIGIGLYSVAFFSVLLILFVLLLGRFLESRLQTKKESE